MATQILCDGCAKRIEGPMAPLSVSPYGEGVKPKDFSFFQTWAFCSWRCLRLFASAHDEQPSRGA